MNDKIIKDISENRGTILLYIDEEGSVVMITSGDITKKQNIAANKLLIVIGNHSIIFSIVLYLEIIFTKISFYFSSLFKKNN